MTQGRPPSDEEQKDIDRLRKHPATKAFAKDFVKDAKPLVGKPPARKKKK